VLWFSSYYICIQMWDWDSYGEVWKVLAVWCTVFWDVMLHNLRETEQYSFCLFDPEGWGRICLQNISEFLPYSMASHPKIVLKMCVVNICYLFHFVKWAWNVSDRSGNLSQLLGHWTRTEHEISHQSESKLNPSFKLLKALCTWTVLF
jgi:hypothetical protein